jgi:hypothetical protein
LLWDFSFHVMRLGQSPALSPQRGLPSAMRGEEICSGKAVVFDGTCRGTIVIAGI